MDSLLRSSHRSLTILAVATLAGCAAPVAVIRGSVSLPGSAPAGAALAAHSGPTSAPRVASDLPVGASSRERETGSRALSSGGKSGSGKTRANTAGAAPRAPFAGARERDRARGGARRAGIASHASSGGGTQSSRREPSNPDGAAVTDAVVFVDRVAEPPRAGRHVAPPPGGRMLLDVNGFGPRVVAVARGDSVVFENRDRRWHNPFSVSAARPFDVGTIRPGGARAVQFDRAGPVRVFCRLHADSSAYVFVTPSPCYARPDRSGGFALPPLPPGSYVVRGWHPRYGERRWRVELPRKGIALDLSF